MKKMGFWSVLAIVLGAQVGSGVLILPANLATFGCYTIYGWLVACMGAILLAIVFANLCSMIPKTGGPHAYVNEAFGRTASFFTGWTYWLISWISTSVVVISCVGYLSPFIGSNSENVYLFYEILLLTIITIINCVSVELSGKLEFILTALKFAPLIIIPILTIPHFSLDNFAVAQGYENFSSADMIKIAFWGFIGVECATTPAGAVEHPKRNIPLAIILGTSCAAILYLVNCLGIMGSINGDVLANCNAPYVEFAKIAFKNSNAEYIIGIIGFIICVGTLNAWTLTSGQIALGLAEDKLLPKIFSKINKNKAPYFNIILSYFGIVLILFLTKQKTMSKQITEIIDFSVISFLFIYLISSISYLKIIKLNEKLFQFLLACGACVFCTLVIGSSGLSNVFLASTFTLSGILMLPFIKRQK